MGSGCDLDFDAHLKSDVFVRTASGIVDRYHIKAPLVFNNNNKHR